MSCKFYLGVKVSKQPPRSRYSYVLQVEIQIVAQTFPPSRLPSLIPSYFNNSLHNLQKCRVQTKPISVLCVDIVSLLFDHIKGIKGLKFFMHSSISLVL